MLDINFLSIISFETIFSHSVVGCFSVFFNGFLYYAKAFKFN